MALIYADNPNVFEFGPAKNSLTNSVETTAIVNLTISDGDGDVVTGPIVMPHVLQGVYRVTLGAELGLVPNRSYWALLTATIDGVKYAHIEECLMCVKRYD